MSLPPEDQVDTHVYVKMPDHLRKRLYGDNPVPGSFPREGSYDHPQSFNGNQQTGPDKQDKKTETCC